ncbi:MAG: hypothetical protein HC933_17165 [Pleurocapsa sp. SU_196_0]|nr:hypothetical protein [Pleurocapsa sp. SU_196_0]
MDPVRDRQRHLDHLEAEIGEVALPGEVALDERTAQPAPGMLLKHYSPRAKLWLLEYGTNLEARLKAQATQARGARLGLLLPTSSLAWLSDVDAVRFDLGDSPTSVASRLFMGMRALDSAGCTTILTHGFAAQGLGRALNDRLYRAASGNVIRDD